LRFTPAATSDNTPSTGTSFLSKLMPRGPRQPGKKTGGKGQISGAAQVWVVQDGHPFAVQVTAGLSNGRQTEITDGDLKAGMAVITDYQEAKP